MREDDRPDRWDHPDPDRPEGRDGPDQLDSRDRLDRPEGSENERIIEERVVSRTTEWEYEEPPPPVRTEVPIRAPPPRSYRWVGALIVAAALIAAAFGAWALLSNQESPSTPETTPSAPSPEVTSPNATTPNATTPNATEPAPAVPDATAPEPSTPNASTPEVISPVPEGVIDGTAVQSAEAAAAGNVTAITPATFAQLSENLAFTSIQQGPLESLATVAVTNNQAQGVPIGYSGFLATLADGTVVAPTNAADIVLAPGTTTFLTLNFPTGGQAITSISYSAGGTSFSVPVQGASTAPEGASTSIQTPGGLVPNTNIGFVSPTVWQGDDSAVVLVQATNSNPGAVSISPSDFWIDLGGGTWVQASSVNNNVPASLEPGVTETFTVGFSGVSGVTPDQVWYWPGGPSLERIGIAPTAGEVGPQIYQISAAADPDPARQDVNLVLLSNAAGADSVSIDDVTAYTYNGGVYTPESCVAGTTDLPGNPGVGSATVTFDIPRDDAITLISFVQNGETRYLQL